jgi:hypothetical protein
MSAKVETPVSEPNPENDYQVNRNSLITCAVFIAIFVIGTVLLIALVLVPSTEQQTSPTSSVGSQIPGITFPVDLAPTSACSNVNSCTPGSYCSSIGICTTGVSKNFNEPCSSSSECLFGGYCSGAGNCQPGMELLI